MFLYLLASAVTYTQGIERARQFGTTGTDATGVYVVGYARGAQSASTVFLTAKR